MRIFHDDVSSFVLLLQERRPAPRSASPSPPRSRRAGAPGLTSAPSAMRTPWTLSSTPADTCVSATPAASSWRRCPTPAVPSAGDRSKTSSRRIAAHKERLSLTNSHSRWRSGTLFSSSGIGESFQWGRSWTHLVLEPLAVIWACLCRSYRLSLGLNVLTAPPDVDWRSAWWSTPAARHPQYVTTCVCVILGAARLLYRDIWC